jgi:cytochrome c551
MRLLTIGAILLFCFWSCGPTGDEKSMKFKQYYLKGEALYVRNCSNCHQKDGSGLAMLIPPLDTSDFIMHKHKVICLMKHGMTGELLVNGKSYNQPMPGFRALSEIELAQISTYISNTWSNQYGITEINEVTEALKTCPN